MTDWTRTFSPHVVNDFRMGVNYVSTHSGGIDNGLGNVADELGIQGVNTRGPGLNALNFSGGFVSGFGSANIGTQQLFPSTVIQVSDTLMWMKGSHTLHLGFSSSCVTASTPSMPATTAEQATLISTEDITAGPSPDAVSGSGSGSPEADFFLGLRQ